MAKIDKITTCCQKVLPLVYDESLSYYEVLCKVQQKLNELIKINNNIRDEVHSDYIAVLEGAKVATEAVASVTTMRDEVLTLKQATEQYAHDVVTVYNQTVEARDTAIAKADIAERSATTATEKANIASTSATTATEKANIAVQSANTATQKANSASQSATVATTKASEAQTSANNAKQYANEAKESAGLVGLDVTQLKQDVRNLQTSVNENTSDISSLTTKVDNNTSQITTLHSMIAVYWKTLYPVGSIYISTSATFNPQTTWGGTWVKTADGRCLIGANDTYPLGSTGGYEKHTHNCGDLISKIGPYGDNLTVNIRQTAAWTSDWTYQFTRATQERKNNNYAVRVEGTTAEASNMQPYLAVYIWERTA